MRQFLVPVKYIQFFLFQKRDSEMSKFDRKAFLIDRFNKSTAFILINFKARPDYRVALFLEYYFRHSSPLFQSINGENCEQNKIAEFTTSTHFRPFRVFRG